MQQALDETAQLAQRIYPPLLETGGLAVALRAAAVSAGVRVTLDVPAGASYPPEVAGTIYWCCLAALERAERATVTVRDEEKPSPSRWSRTVAIPMQPSGCATASRRWAAG